MSKIFVDQVDPKTATTLTLGTTGDTVDIPSGVTLSGSGTITPSAINIAASGAGGVTGILPVANGGTATTSYTPGITTASQWRITASLTNNQVPITSGWEINDTAGYGGLGSAMTQSSGIFTFPSTGIWYINFHASFYVNGWDDALQKTIIQTTINDSAYTQMAQGMSTMNSNNNAGFWYTSGDAFVTFDVTDTANCKVRFCTEAADTGSGTATYGDSNISFTYATFIRLGDT